MGRTEGKCDINTMSGPVQEAPEEIECEMGVSNINNNMINNIHEVDVVESPIDPLVEKKEVCHPTINDLDKKSFEGYVTRRNKNKYACLLCKAELSSKIRALSHVESKHFPNSSNYSCSFCGAHK